MFKKIITILATIGLIMAIETPTFKLLEKNGNIEIRVYDSMVIAKTLVEESYDSASKQRIWKNSKLYSLVEMKKR